jgi:hypothetical protein
LSLKCCERAGVRYFMLQDLVEVMAIKVGGVVVSVHVNFVIFKTFIKLQIFH